MKLEALSRGMADVVEERKRQGESEGHTPAHDDAHQLGEIARAAAAYARSAAAGNSYGRGEAERLWPFSWGVFKPKTKRQDLVRAAALCVAEIDRLDRVEERASWTDEQARRGRSA